MHTSRLFSGRRFPGPMEGAALALVASLVFAPAAFAADPPASLFVERVDVNVINVEVFVTDRNGERVEGLVADDFEIREDGAPVEVTNFFAVDRGDRVIRSLEADRRSIGGGEPPPLDVPEDQRLNLLVYVDHFNLSPASKARVLEQLEDFLEDRLIQGDNVGLVAYDRRLKIVQPFTRDRRAIDGGIAALRRLATSRQIDEAERRQAMLQMRTGFPDFRAGYSVLRSYVERSRGEVRRATEALGSVVRSLAGLPGRRAILYVSEGLAMRPGEDLYQYFIDLYGAGNVVTNGQLSAAGIDPFVESVSENEKGLFDSVTRHANAHQVTFYTLDARGGGGDRSFAADSGDLGVAAAGPRALDQIRSAGLQEPLLEMAVATGGAAVLNTYGFDTALAGLAEDFDSFYSLGYRSRRGGDGKYHKIEVRVKKPGMTARHRTGYVDKPEVERVADRTLSSLLLDLEANPLNVAVDFGKAEKKGRDEYHLPMIVRIPFREVTLLPNGEVEEARLKIFVVVQDEDGDVSKLQEIPYPLTVPHAQVAEARGRDIGWATTLAIRAGVPTVAVGVWDELSGVESFIQKKVVVEKGRGQGKGP